MMDGAAILVAAILGSIVGWILRGDRVDEELELSYNRGRYDALKELGERIKRRAK